ncbi:inner centromere protein-like [Phascolarctos cinereus]|uniref:Uncharacterized protein LOC110203996 n=1 Tax=Phascolarctos cinereus TaxID=38626 RepID=A0A6P5JW89_PHACI|nr:uncharacterized protein LOC110203996 [Phascolarctos cinereus]
MVLPIKPMNLAAVNGFVPVIEISVSEQQSAENYLVTNKTKTAVVSLGCKDELMSKQQAESLPEPAPGTFLVVPTEVPEVQAAGSVAKLQIAQPVAVMTKPGRAPSSPGTQTQPEIELLLDLLESPQTVIGPCCDWCSVRRSLVRKFSQAHRAFLIRKDSVVPKKISSARRSSRKLALEPAVTGYITCKLFGISWALKLKPFVPRSLSAFCLVLAEMRVPQALRFLECLHGKGIPGLKKSS